MATVGLRVTLLGGFEAHLASGVAITLPTKKAQALLAYLGARSGQRHLRDKLAALLWGSKSDDRARGDLRHALVTLRRALADADPPALRIEGQALALNPEAVEVDVVSFERQVAEGTVTALERAAELYRGDLLLGFALDEPLFEEWLVTERERLREMAIDALGRLLSHQASTGATERAIQTAVRLLGLDPLQEAVHRTLMRLYSRQGRRSAALKQYQACVGALQRELGTAPEEETKKLYQELLRRPTPPATPEPHEGARAVAARRSGGAPPDLPAPETPLIGRGEELGHLRRLLQDAVRGRGQCATVVGEAGIGKTQLVSTVAAEAAAHACRVLIGHGHESDSILPFGPWVDACRRGSLAADGALLEGLQPRWRAELSRLLPEMGVAGLPDPADDALPLFESVAHLIEQLAARQPVVLVLEDLHWADEMSLRLLSFIGRRVSEWPVLLIATAREEELAETSMARRTMEDLSRTSRLAPLALSPLSRSDTARLVRALARVGSDPATLARVEQRIWSMSEGNPFVAVEGMHAFEQGGFATGAAEDPAAMAMPARVRELVARRLARLAADTQQVAAMASVIGRRFDFDLLCSASGVDAHRAAEAVEEMVRAHVLQAVGDQLDFTHDRVREVVYGRLLAPRRRLLHRAVVDALEAAGADTPDAHIEPLAQHALRAELWERAVRYLRQAGVKAAARSALADARARLEQALGALARLPESRASLEQGLEIRLELRPVLTQLGRARQALECLREAETLAERLDDNARRGRVAAFLTNIHAMLGELDEALGTGTRALALAGQLGDEKLRVLSTTYLVVTLGYRGDFGRVVELATDNLARLPATRGYGDPGLAVPPSVFDRGHLVIALAELGRFADGAPHEAEAIRLAELTQHAYTVGFAYRTAAVPHLLKGDWATALSRLEPGIAALRSVPLALPIVVAGAAWALAELDRASEALDRLAEGEPMLDEQVARGLVGQSGWVYHALGRACLRLGRLDDARRLARRAIECSRRHPAFEGYARLLVGDIAARSGALDVESAEAEYRSALGLAERHGMRPLAAHCHFGLGQLRVRTGRAGHWPEHLAAAVARYREMSMRPWLGPAEAVAG